MESQRVLKARKKFWMHLLSWTGISGILIYFILYEFPTVFKLMIFAFGFITYIYSYICGYSDGKEHVLSVLDFIDGKTRWKVLQTEQNMYDKEDHDYNNN